MAKIGERVGAMASATKDEVSFFGYGVYEADEIPPKDIIGPFGPMTRTNPVAVGDRIQRRVIVYAGGEMKMKMAGECGPEEVEVLPVGTRVRHRKHPELTGIIDHYEWQRPGILSAIPYRVEWDDMERAHALCGMLYFYQHDGGIIEESPIQRETK